MREEIQMREKQPRRESARMAPTRGKKLTQPLTMLLIWAASMLFTLKLWIKNTMRLFSQPAAANVSPNMVAAGNYVINYNKIGNKRDS